MLLLGEVNAALSAAVRAQELILSSTLQSQGRVALNIGGVADRAGLPSLHLVRGNAAIIAALEQGAADVADITDCPKVIAARLSALVRRMPTPTTLRLGALAIDRVDRRVTREGRPIPLLAREYALLLFLARHAGSLITREALRKAVLGLDFDPGTNVIEVHMSRLRAKLDRGFAAPMLRTEKGRGYRLVLDGAPFSGPHSAIAGAVPAG